MALDVAPSENASPAADPRHEPEVPVAPKRISDDPTRQILIGGGIAVGFFVIFLGWAAFTPLDAGAYASGVIAVSGNRQAVQNRDGGVVTALHVVEGQEVEKGQILVEIGAGDLRAAERGMTGQVLTLLAQRARLVAERDGRSSFAPPPEFATLAPEDRPIAQDVLNLQRRQFDARGQSITTQKGVLQQRIAQLNEQVSGSQRQLTANREQQRLIAEETAGMKSLADQGFAPVNRVRALERSQAQLVGEEGALVAQIARSREAMGEARLQMLSLDRQKMEEVAGQLRDVQVQLDELQPKLKAAREQLARAIVRAPASGKVVGMSIFTVGGVVSPGQVLMEVVPGNKALVIQASVNPNDADDLKVGQETQVRFTSLHERSLPILHGKLTKISADSFVDEKSGHRYFRAEVSVPEGELAKIRKVRPDSSPISPGLPVEVIVPLRKRSALQYLVEPLISMAWRSGREH
ncbi:MAG: HlyD family type I secretion periplasmic adaptor subunit [Caulobacter sp.]|nr:HlyD family type I secretion periplasmic adaptor subunit [Caulobacter sp.]